MMNNENAEDLEPYHHLDGDLPDVLADFLEEEQQFDRTLPASHSYMGNGLVTVRGRLVLEAGWVGRVPVVAHHGTVFPGETVPMLVPNARDTPVLTQAIRDERVFGLLCPDETGSMVSGFGVLCEVFEAGPERDAEFTIKARANYRFRLVSMPKNGMPLHMFAKMRYVEVRILPEVYLGEMLRPIRLMSLDPHRRGRTKLDQRLRTMDAGLTPWPLFVYDIFDYPRIRKIMVDHFKMLLLDNLPEDPVSLSFWVASNLALSSRDRLALFQVDNAMMRLHLELRLITRKSVLCCSSCMNEIARREHILAMSSEGVHSNYTNLGGYMHDIVTVARASNITLSGAPSTEFSWFPGYSWSIALCAQCVSHVGWRFDAQKRNLRPAQFFGLCRNHVQPLADHQEQQI